MKNQVAIPDSVHGESAYDAEYQVTTRDGISFDSRASIWPVDAKRSVNIGRVRESFDDYLLDGLNGTLRSFARTGAPGTILMAATVLANFQSLMFPGTRVGRWDIGDLRSYRAKLLDKYGNEAHLIRLRSILKLWNALRFPGVSASTVEELKQMRLKGTPVGYAVRTLDPEKGPLTPEELQQLTLDVYKTAENGQITLEQLSLFVFHLVTGRRPVQTAALKCNDVDGSRKKDPEPGQRDGEPLRLLHVPRAKQQGHHFRMTRRSIHLTEVYFALFVAQRGLVQNRLCELLSAHGFELQLRDLRYLLDKLPLFPCWESVGSTLKDAAEKRVDSHALALESLRVHAEGQYWHSKSSSVTQRLRQVCKVAGAKSVSGGPLTLGGNRLRYTKGTDLARQGVDQATIAWLMDHSSLHSAAIYTDNLAEHAAQVNDALDGSVVLSRVASLFRGEVVDSEIDAVGDSDPKISRIHYKGEGAATCGKNKQCGMGHGIPLLCYTCDLFKPWIDGPHELVLKDLQSEKARNTEVLGKDHPVTRRHDKTIAAVISVIHRCDARKREIASQIAEGS